MAEEPADTESDVIMDIFDAGNDAGNDAGLVCRVCGSLVPATGEYPKAHWDWHEASNGA